VAVTVRRAQINFTCGRCGATHDIQELRRGL
jgi:hypothetical protein